MNPISTGYVVAATEIGELFVANVLRLLAARKMTRSALAEKSGIDFGQLSNILSGGGNVQLATLGKIAKALKADPDELLRDPEAEKSAVVAYLERELAAQRSQGKVKTKK